MGLFDGSTAGDRNDDEQSTATLWLGAAGLIGFVVLWLLFGHSPITRFLLAAPLIGSVVLLARFGIRQARPQDKLPPLVASASEMTPRSRWDAARFRHAELARDYLPYLEDADIRARAPGLVDGSDPATRSFHDAVRRAEHSATTTYPGEARAVQYADAVQALAHHWEVARRKAVR